MVCCEAFFQDEAETIFEGSRIHITTYGRRLLGAAVAIVIHLMEQMERLGDLLNHMHLNSHSPKVSLIAGHFFRE